MSSASGHVLETELWVPASIEIVWDFFKDSQNLAKLTPQQYGISVESEGFAREGQEVRLILAPFGWTLPLKWTALISNVVETGTSRQFVDTQTAGPFSRWTHTHRFEAGSSEVESQNGARVPSGHAGTWLRDRVEYELPAGAAGELAHTLFGRRNLENMFAFRRSALWSLFGESK